MKQKKPTHTAYFADNTTYTFSYPALMRVGWALEEAAKRNTKVLRII